MAAMGSFIVRRALSAYEYIRESIEEIWNCWR